MYTLKPQELKIIWMGVMLVILATTSPKWLGPNAIRPLEYDAPWVYPSQNPTVKAELDSGTKQIKKIHSGLTMAP